MPILHPLSANLSSISLPGTLPSKDFKLNTSELEISRRQPLKYPSRINLCFNSLQSLPTRFSISLKHNLILTRIIRVNVRMVDIHLLRQIHRSFEYFLISFLDNFIVFSFVPSNRAINYCFPSASDLSVEGGNKVGEYRAAAHPPP
jgi:hypothetical protein